MKNIKTAAIDLGYGWTKAKVGARIWRQPSVLGEAKPLFDENLRNTDVIFDNKYFVGDLAVRHSDVRYYSTKDNKAETWTTEILLKTALGALAANEQVNVVTGLPIDFYFKQKDTMVKMLDNVNQGDAYRLQIGRSFDVDTRPKIIQSKIVPQPLGTAMNYLLDDMGQLINIEAAQNRILVIDWGKYTLDLLVLDAMEIGKESNSPEKLGVDTAYKLLQGYLREVLGKAPTRYDLDRYVMEGEYEGYNIIPLVEKAFKALAAQIMLEVEGLNMNFYKILVTGGWAGRIAKYLNFDKEKVEVFGQAGNVDGYEKIGAKSWGRT